VQAPPVAPVSRPAEPAEPPLAPVGRPVEPAEPPAAVVETVDTPAPPPVSVSPVAAADLLPTLVTAPPAAAQAAAPAMRAMPAATAGALDSLIGPLFGTNPAAPLESPGSWVVLAATRRQLGTATPVVAPAATVSTGQVVAAPAAAVAPAPAAAVAAAPAAAVANQPPVISTVVVGAPNSTTGAVIGTVTASDANGDAMTYKATTTTKGTVAITAAGVFTYTPTTTARHAAAKIGATTAATTDAVTVVVTDAKGATAARTVTVPVSPKNAVPVATKTVGSPNATTAVITGTVSATDADTDTLTYSAPTTTAKGSVSINPATGSFTYTPTAAARNTAAGAYATAADTSDTVTVTVTDGYGGSVAVPVAVTVGPKSYVSFTFNYGTGSQYWTPQSRAALELAATKVASYLVVSAPTTIVYDVTANSAPLSTNLAWATSDLVRTSSGFYSTVVQNKIQTGADANGSAADGVVNVNLGQNWGYGNSVDQWHYDFTGTLMHEFVHTLGFITYVGQPGSNTGQIWTRFDSFMVTSSKVKVIGPTTLRWNTAYNGNLTGRNGGLYFGGPNAVAAYGGPVPLYTPSVWTAGSSVNHLNDAVFSGTNKRLMNAIVATGQGLRALSPVELGVLKDLGYAVVPVPGGVALVFVSVMFLRRRRVA
jgi:VCBS repeat-containing protein